jgi:hypothetical protein
MKAFMIVFCLGTLGACPQSNAQTAPNPGQWSLTLHGSLPYALAGNSTGWTDTRTGAGINWGARGDVQFHWPLRRWLGVGGVAGYTQWQVQRRFLEASVPKYTSDQAVNQYALMGFVRVYPYRSAFLQLMGGGQYVQVVQQFSDTYPGQRGDLRISGIRPSVGGIVGYEFRRKWFVADVGVEYRMLPNDRLETLEGPLHTIGLRIGIGWQKP